MIWLTEEDRELLKKMEDEISKEEMQANWEAFMELTPIHSGSEEEEEAFQFLKAKLEEYGLEPEILRYDAYISDPKYAKLEILQPLEMELKCTPYRQVGTTDHDGIEGEVIYIAPEDIGRAACRDKIVLCEQQTAGDWMGLRAGLLLRLQEMGIKGLIVIEQDSYKPDVVHQRSDFSVSGNPTSDNIDRVQTIPAIVHLTNRDGASIRELVKRGGVMARVTSVVETGWKNLGLLIAEIRGEVEPERFILVNAHIDTPPFSPGVVDNASGDVAVLELARIFQMNQERLRRSVRIAFWSAHEIGRYAGSTYFNDHFWHDLRYNCVASYNIDSPGAKGASTFRAAPISEVLEAALDSIKSATGIEVESLRWPTRAGDGSFWGTGVPHMSLTSSRPPEDYDPHVNYSGGGWWWHTPHAMMEHGDIDVMEMDVRVELNYIFKMANCPVLPLNFAIYSEHILKILTKYQVKADGVKDRFNLDPILARAEEFRDLARKLEDTVKSIPKKGNPSEPLRQELNHCLLWVSRHINPVAHSDAGLTEQVSMETFGATPFPRIVEITRLAGMDPETPEFGFLRTKLIRQRNAVEDGFYQANELIKRTLERLRLLTI
jgi:hypothetical protein